MSAGSTKCIGTGSLVQLILSFCYFLFGGFVNGQQNSLERRLDSLAYDQTCWLMTHNAYNYGPRHKLPNQSLDLTAQLEIGVRGFMLDVHILKGEPVLFHGSKSLGHRSLAQDLGAIRRYLEQDSMAIVTIIFEDHVPASMLLEHLEEAGLTRFLHKQPLSAPWPKLMEMRANGHRLIVFAEQDTSLQAQGIHHAWTFLTENHYSNHRWEDFSTTHNRGDSTNRLYLLNHFLTHPSMSVGSRKRTHLANSKKMILTRARLLMEQRGRMPNFVAVDFVEIGEPLEAVDTINLIRLQHGPYLPNRLVAALSRNHDSLTIRWNRQPPNHFEIRYEYPDGKRVVSWEGLASSAMKSTHYLPGLPKLPHGAILHFHFSGLAKLEALALE